MTESESVALPLGDTPTSFLMGWVVGFEPTYTGATTLGLNHLTIPTIFYIFKKLATWNGLEPSTSSVTGWHSNQLNYQAAIGGSNRARTCDPLLVRQMLSQLSYTPKITFYKKNGSGEWSRTTDLPGMNRTL